MLPSFRGDVEAIIRPGARQLHLEYFMPAEASFPPVLSFPRKRESIHPRNQNAPVGQKPWIPAFAGMTERCESDFIKTQLPLGQRAFLSRPNHFTPTLTLPPGGGNSCMAPGFALILGKPGSVKITPANTERQDEHDDENQLAQCTSTGLHLRAVRGKADGAGRTQQDRPQREMPVRQRQEVQTLPRRLTGNQRCFKDSQKHRSRPPRRPST